MSTKPWYLVKLKRHHVEQVGFCVADGEKWPCDVKQLIDATNPPTIITDEDLVSWREQIAKVSENGKKHMFALAPDKSDAIFKELQDSRKRLTLLLNEAIEAVSKSQNVSPITMMFLINSEVESLDKIKDANKTHTVEG